MKGPNVREKWGLNNFVFYKVTMHVEKHLLAPCFQSSHARQVGGIGMGGGLNTSVLAFSM